MRKIGVHFDCSGRCKHENGGELLNALYLVAYLILPESGKNIGLYNNESRIISCKSVHEVCEIIKKHSGASIFRINSQHDAMGLGDVELSLKPIIVECENKK